MGVNIIASQVIITGGGIHDNHSKSTVLSVDTDMYTGVWNGNEESDTGIMNGNTNTCTYYACMSTYIHTYIHTYTQSQYYTDKGIQNGRET